MIYNYPKFPCISPVTGMPERPLYWEYFIEYAKMKYEQGGDKDEIQRIVDNVEQTILKASELLCALKDDPKLAQCEPNTLPEIMALREAGGKALWTSFDKELYRDRIKGSILGRFAGCTLGATVEFWSIEGMRDWAKYCGQQFPPVEYWKATKNPNDLHYEVSYSYEYERDNLKGVPVDDDITYPILGLLVLEHGGLNFTTRDVAEVWKKELPRACTAEEVVLNHINNGVDPMVAAEIDNPYQQWIGADIRADAFGWAAPGLPEKAARMAYQDAFLTHRRNGIYGEMFFAAAISAAFALGDVFAALKEALLQIPKDSLLHRDMVWAIEKAPSIKDYAHARATVEEYFGGMSGVHTNLNAALTVFGLAIGGDDFTKVIGEVTAMGYDNDCNAATAGSIFGAAKGISAIPKHWYECFNDTVYTYLNNNPELSLTDVYARFEKLAESLF